MEPNSNGAHDVFVSHHNSSAPELAKLKNELKTRLGLSAFLAHQDIESDESFNKKIVGALRECRYFLYVANAEANQSNYCQQEIGMALALNKTIYSVMYKCKEPPKGFISDKQARKINSIDQLINHVCFKLMSEHLSDSEKVHLGKLGMKGFKIVDSLSIADEQFILLRKDTWNDYGYRTNFTAKYKDKYFYLKIGGHNNQELNSDNYPSKFPKLNYGFYSLITNDENLPDNESQHICALLNCLEDLDAIALSRAIKNNSDILRRSFYRDRDDRFNQLKEKCLMLSANIPL